MRASFEKLVGGCIPKGSHKSVQAYKHCLWQLLIANKASCGVLLEIVDTRGDTSTASVRNELDASLLRICDVFFVFINAGALPSWFCIFTVRKTNYAKQSDYVCFGVKICRVYQMWL